MTSAQKERKAEMQTSSVYYGDCFKHLTQWNNWNHPEIFPNGTKRMTIDMRLADLIYLDPPWNSNANYNILWDKGKNKDKGHTAQATAFTDIWHWSDAADRLNRMTQGYISRNDPLYPVHKAKKSIHALSQFLPRKGMLAYLTYMAERLAFCHALLKETGSICLHCDSGTSHYLKMIMEVQSRRRPRALQRNHNAEAGLLGGNERHYLAVRKNQRQAWTRRS